MTGGVAVMATVALLSADQAAPGGRQGGGRGRAAGPAVPTLPPPTLPVTLAAGNTSAYRVVEYATGLANPWSLAFLPDGDMLVTERAGRLRIIRNGVLDAQPIAGVPDVVAQGQGGLLEVALHPQFAQNQIVYLTYSKPGENELNTTALARGRLQGSTLADVQDIFVADAWRDAAQHFGSRIAFDRAGKLYMTVGERNDRTRAQDTTNHAGTVLRLNDDGTVPPDNPFVGREGFRPEIYSYGHRNPQGLAFHPTTGELWETEHAPQGGDELNVIHAGRNYGWPVATFGREYSGQMITSQPVLEGMEPPFTIWVPSIAVSGLAFYTGDKFPQWQGSLFAGGLAGMQITRMQVEEGRLTGRQTLLAELKRRVRDVRQSPDGFLYVLTDHNPGQVLRIEPPAVPQP
jgi:glucose/arabinose dehydrogenase